MPDKIGLFGGTFDPVHMGHRSIAESFLQSGLIDELWVLLTPFPPHKQGNHKASYSLREKMLKKALKGIDQLSIHTIENELPKPSYSVQTIRYLKEQHPDYIFYYCMGEDSLAQFHKWKFYEEILEECELLVAHRPGADHEDVEERILRKTNFVDHDPLDISSTEIKQKVQQGESIDDLVHPDVHTIIESEDLYQ